MGIAGAAWATVIGQVVSGIMVILYLRKFKTVKLTKEKLRPHPHYIGRIVSLGMAPFFNQVSMMVVQIVMNNVLIRYGAKSSYGSDIPLACAGIITKINMIFFAINIGISQGLQPIISYNYGARKLDRVREAYLKAAISATIISTVSFICSHDRSLESLGLKVKLISVLQRSFSESSCFVPLLMDYSQLLQTSLQQLERQIVVFSFH